MVKGRVEHPTKIMVIIIVTTNIIITTLIMVIMTIAMVIITKMMIRQEAVDYMEANTALSRVAVEREVTFYFEFTLKFTLNLL